MLFRGICFINLLLLSSGAVVKWLPNASFNSPINFEDHVLPCSRQTVVFPTNLQGSVQIEDTISVSGFILPENGELFLSKGAIYFGEDNHVDNCTKNGNAFFMDKSISSWAQPDVWSSERFNKATPDSERLPCFDDTVIFPPNTTFLIELPQRTQEVHRIKLEDHFYDTYEFAKKIFQQQNSAQQFMTNEKSAVIGVQTTSRPCGSSAGCSCQKLPLEIDCSLKYCQVPSCESPVQPKGHCCKICGGELVFAIDESFNMHKFRDLVETTIKSYGENYLAYHIGRLIDNSVQLIVVDSDNYEGVSAQVVNAIDHAVPRHWVQGVKVAQFSGSPLYKSGLGGRIFVSMFFTVSLAMAAIYLYYYKFTGINIPMPNVGRGMISRFQRRTDSVVSLTRTDSVCVRQGGRTAFRNPLYDSKRGKVEMEESAMES